jgi:excinuclease ABC subunit B
MAITVKEKPFELVADYQPSGDQPKAIEELLDGLNKGVRMQTLLGVTGSGKTYTMAKIIEATQRPALVITHNKTLAAQLTAEYRTFFPGNFVGYFVSYYDYYQPEAYVPERDLYVEKDADVNEEVDRLRHASTQALLSRRDVIIVATVSCIYGLGSPSEYTEMSVSLKVGAEYERRSLLRKLIDMQYLRNDISLIRGSFSVKGDTIELYPVNEDIHIRLMFFGDEIERILRIHPVTGEVLESVDEVTVFPASHYVILPERLEVIRQNILKELNEQIEFFEKIDKKLEAQRIKDRTLYDLECMKELGYCSGIENYSRHFSGREPGEPPATLVEYFPDDYLMIIDESHQTIPQLNGMYNGDYSRKRNLVDYGFRLPSALDNRPLKFNEFEKYINQVIYTTATPGPYEREHSGQTVELIIRPTGLIDPRIEIRPIASQVDDLMEEVRLRAEKGQRSLVTTLTKKMSEDLTDYLERMGHRVRYLHSEIDTLDRVRILRDLRRGEFDVLVGINLLREGLDLPEVSLVAILDADKSGFLRSETSLIQTMGRAARHSEGTVLIYADTMTPAIKAAVEETDRRRKIQDEYNRIHGITPKSIQKGITDIAEGLEREEEEVEAFAGGVINFEGIELRRDEVPQIVEMIRSEMLDEAKELNFEHAAELRDEIRMLEEFLEGKAKEGKGRRRKKRVSTPGQARHAKLKRRSRRSRNYRG